MMLNLASVVVRHALYPPVQNSCTDTFCQQSKIRRSVLRSPAALRAGWRCHGKRASSFTKDEQGSSAMLEGTVACVPHLHHCIVGLVHFWGDFTELHVHSRSGEQSLDKESSSSRTRACSEKLKRRSSQLNLVQYTPHHSRTEKAATRNRIRG